MSDTTVRMQLDVNQQGNAAQGMRDLAEAANSAAAAEKKYQEALRSRIQAHHQGQRMQRDLAAHGIGARPGALQRLATGGLGNMISGMGPMIGGMTAGAAGLALMHTAAAGLTTAAGMMTIGQDEGLSGAQKRNKIMEDLPVIGGFIASVNKMKDAVDGTAAAIVKAEKRFEQQAMQARQSAQLSGTRMGSEAEIGHHQRLAAAYGGIAVGPSPVRRFFGDVGAEEAEARLGASDELARARARAAAARGDVAASRARLGGLVAGRSALEDKVAAGVGRDRQLKADADAWSGENKGGRVSSALETKAAEVRLAEQQKLVEQEIGRAKQANLASAEAESAVRKAEIGQMQAELGILKQREAMMSGTARRMGSMNVMERQLGLQALKMVQKHGIGNVAEDVRQAAERFSPELMAKWGEKFGENTAEGQEYKRMLQDEGMLGKDAGTLEQTRAKIAKVQTDVRVAVNLDTNKLSAEIAKALKDVLGGVIKNIQSQHLRERQEMETGNMVRNAQR